MTSRGAPEPSSSRSNPGNALRPRNPRTITGLEDFEDPGYKNAADSSATASSYHSRAPSPIPSKHPSRVSSNGPINRRDQSPLGSDLAASLTGLWGKSWTSLQGIASNVLGSDTSFEHSKDKSPSRTRRPFEATHSKGTAKAWGPTASTSTLQPGSGTQDKRTAKVMALKKKELLMSNPENGGDSLGRHKRRTSDDLASTSAPPGAADDRDLLVYIHYVTSKDTLAGISIKYNCRLEAVKKANRLWSNDGIQVRKHLVIPIDACSIRGRRVQAPGNAQDDLLANVEEQPTPAQSSISHWREGVTEAQDMSHIHTSSPVKTSALPLRDKEPEAPPWQHDSWIMLEGQTASTEIARLPRSEMGYFPRTRRKSISYSDLDSPPPSMDLYRPSIIISDSASVDAKAAIGHHRRSSSSQQFAKQMVGPGGVGSLVGKGPSAPGPAQDKFTKAISKAIPSLINSQPRTSFEDDAIASSGTSTPIANLENIGSSLEGWVRKLAKSAAKAVEPTHDQNMQRAEAGGQAISTPNGDLIELNDAFAVGDDDEPDARGRQPLPRSGGFDGPSGTRKTMRERDPSYFTMNKATSTSTSKGSGKSKGE